MSLDTKVRVTVLENILKSSCRVRTTFLCVIDWMHSLQKLVWYGIRLLIRGMLC